MPGNVLAVLRRESLLCSADASGNSREGAAAPGQTHGQVSLSDSPGALPGSRNCGGGDVATPWELQSQPKGTRLRRCRVSQLCVSGSRLRAERDVEIMVQ